MSTPELGAFHPVTKEGCRTPSPGQEHMSATTAPLSSSSSVTSHEHAVHAPVPNPFGNPAPAPSVAGHPVHQWGSNIPPNPNPPNHAANSPVPAVVSPQPGGNSSWSVANSESCPNFSVGTTNPPLRKAGRRRYGKSGENGTESVNARRQKRLERNRESARLSRRRRKQYLEVLEDRVNQLSMEMDKGRREHVAKAVETILSRRRDALEAADKPEKERVVLLDTALSRTSGELMLATTFKSQQLKSFSLPPHCKFYLWLTLQSDAYFRGGRAASERLSAARIGERMLSSGNDKVGPSQSMWPLFCNEVGLSYDQEEKVRNMQRTLLQNHDSWLERHTAKASDLVMQSCHDATQALTVQLGQSQQAMLRVLTNTQRLKFLSWAERNRDRITQLMKNKTSPPKGETFNVCKSQHTAANLYIINSQLQRLFDKIPRAQPQVTAAELKKLSRRPSFESLGRTGEKGKEDSFLSHDSSFNSSGSLKRSASSLSMEEHETPQVQQISPEEAESSAASTVERMLGFVQSLIPASPIPEYVVHGSASLQLRIPSPTLVTSTSAPVPSSNLMQPYTYVAPSTISTQAAPAPAPVPTPSLAPTPAPPLPLPPPAAPVAPVPPLATSALLVPSAQLPPPSLAPSHYEQPVTAAHPLSSEPSAPPAPLSHPTYVTHQLHSTYPIQPAQPTQPAHPALPANPTRQQHPPLPARPMHLMHSAQPMQLGQPVHTPLGASQFSTTAAPVINPLQEPAPFVQAQAPVQAMHPSRHLRTSSFLPPHLNVVPEEMFPADATDDFLMNLVADEDWAIGEGIDMDTTE